MKTMATLPKNGCGRCVWWKLYGFNPWQNCRLSGVRRWYQNPPCEEYEMDPSKPDEIELDL